MEHKLTTWPLWFWHIFGSKVLVALCNQDFTSENVPKPQRSCGQFVFHCGQTGLWRGQCLLCFKARSRCNKQRNKNWRTCIRHKGNKYLPGCSRDRIFNRKISRRREKSGSNLPRLHTAYCKRHSRHNILLCVSSSARLHKRFDNNAYGSGWLGTLFQTIKNDVRQNHRQE